MPNTKENIMNNMFEELKLRHDNYVTINRSAQTLANISLYEKDYQGDQRELNSRLIQAIGADYIQVEGWGLIDRANIRCVQPINF